MLHFQTFNITARNNKVILTGNNYEPRENIRSTVEKMRKLGAMKTSGEIKSAGRRLIESRFNAWFRTLEYSNSLHKTKSVKEQKRFVLITLTLPSVQMHTDEELKKRALKPYIKYFERKLNMRNWAWKAESQRNGNIHFHIVTDQYIPKDMLNKRWLHYMTVLGYMEKFWEKFPGEMPPFCNVKGQGEMRNPVAYLTKYFEKKENKRKISGAIWRMSKNLLHLSNFSTEVTSDEIDDWLQSDMQNVRRIHDEDFFLVFIVKKPVQLSDIMPQFKNDEAIHWRAQLDILNRPTSKKNTSLDFTETLRALPRDASYTQKGEYPNVEQLLIPDFHELDFRRFRL